MPKKMIIKGVGQFLAKKFSADGKGVEVITLGTLQSLRFDFNIEIDDIFGGDGLFAIDTLIRSKSIEISATDAKFDLDQIQLMMGSTVQGEQTTSLWVLGEQDALVAGALDPGAVAPVAASYAVVDYGDSLFGDGNFSVRLKDSNKLLEVIAYNATTGPSDGEYMIHDAFYAVSSALTAPGVIDDATVTVADGSKFKIGDIVKVGTEAQGAVTGVAGNVLTVPVLVGAQASGALVVLISSKTSRIILPSASVGLDIVYNYQREAEGVDVVDILVDEVPFPVHVVHHGSYLQKDQTYAGVEIELFTCIAQGQFSIDSQRATASASTVSLKIIDPERADGKLGSIKRFQSTKRA